MLIINVSLHGNVADCMPTKLFDEEFIIPKIIRGVNKPIVIFSTQAVS